jgi:tetratricopeptide (TPR) repeat protein
MNVDELIKLGEEAIDQQNWNVAYQYWTEVQVADPDNDWTDLKLGHILIELERYDEAEELITENLQIYPNHPFAHVDLALIAQRQEQWDLAIQRWETVISKFSDYEWAYHFYAIFLNKMGDRDKAERYFLMDVINHPKHVYSHFELIQIAVDKLQFRLAQYRIEYVCKSYPDTATLLDDYKRQIQVRQKQISVRSYFDLKPDKWRQRILKYNITVISQFKCMYVAIPKVATSTVLRNLRYITHGDDQFMTEDLRDAMKGIIMPDQTFTGDYWEKVISVINDKDYFVFTFVRNPYTRILSAYLEKFLHPEHEWNHFRTELAFEPNIVSNKVSFVEFLRRVRKYPASDLNAHFTPQWYVLGLDRSMKYDFVGRLENMSSDLSYILSRLDANKATKVLHQAPHAMNAAEKLKQYYGEEEQSLVREIYADDFKYFGYGYDLVLA